MAVRLDAELRPEDFEQYRRELTGYCYRMLGSLFDAEDAVQDTLVRAWRGAGEFEGRSAVRSWLYRMATNVCLDQLRGRQRRARPMEMGPSSATADVTGEIATLPEHAWVLPVPDGSVLATDGDPAELAASKESIRLAFVAALQHLPPRQRAVLILREVLSWHASEVAELLDTSVASVNSALQRARATLSARAVDESGPVMVDEEQQILLAQYVDAFERYDVSRLVALLHEDAVMSMPPYALWLRGADEMAQWFVGPGSGCRGSRVVTTAANGRPAFGSYRPDAAGGWSPWGIHILEMSGGRVVAQHSFIDPTLFPVFGLPEHLDAQAD